MNIFKQAFEKIKHQQQLLAILIFTFVASMIWIGISLFTSQQKTGISDDLLKLSKPLTPSINQDVIQRVQSKGVYLESQLRKFPIYMIRKESGLPDQVVEIGTTPEPTPSPSVKSLPTDPESSSSSEKAKTEDDLTR